jgi:DNA-binding PadR family transcriptional regulator
MGAPSVSSNSRTANRDEPGLYPALQRPETHGLITGEWGVIDNNRQACYYRITAAGWRGPRRRASKLETTCRAPFYGRRDTCRRLARLRWNESVAWRLGQLLGCLDREASEVRVLR